MITSYVLIKNSAARAVCVSVFGGSVDFQLNDEQLHLKKSVRQFAENEIKPHVM